MNQNYNSLIEKLPSFTSKRKVSIENTSPKNQLRLHYQRWVTKNDHEIRFKLGNRKFLIVDGVNYEKKILYDAKCVLEYHRSPFSLEQNEATTWLKNKIRPRIKYEIERYKKCLEILQFNELIIFTNEVRVKPYFDEIIKEVGLNARVIVVEFVHQDKIPVTITEEKWKNKLPKSKIN